MPDSNEIIRSYKRSRDMFQQDYGVHQERLSELHRVNTQLSEISCKKQVDELALTILEAITVRGQDLIRDRIDRPVTAALQTVYQDSSLAFVTEILRTGDRMEVDFRFRRGEEEITGPILDSVGGGLIDIASFTLRLCLFRLEGCEGPLVLDEPFRHVDGHALGRAAEFTNKVASDMGIQIIVITHSDTIASLAKSTFRLAGLGRVV